jgi:outer membrane protein assembly factor BamB
MLNCVRNKPAALALLALAGICGCAQPKGIVWLFATPRPWILAGDSQALSPTIDGNIVFFCGGYAERERSQIYALDLGTGKSKWQYNVGSCGSPPLVSSGVVVAFAFAGQGDRILVYGLDKDSGRQKWKVELPGNPHPPAPAAVGDFIFFAPGSRSVLRIDARNGSVQTFDIDADLSVAAENLWVVAAPGEAIFGYGKSVWRSPIDSDRLEEGPALSEPAGRPIALASDGRILLLGDNEGNLRAFDLRKGTVVWRHHWDKIASAPALAGGTIFLNVYQQKYALAALAVGSGEELWQIPEGGISAPYSQGGRVYVASGKSVMGVDGATGKILWRFATTTEVTTTPVPSSDLVLFGTVRGVLYAARTP